MSFASLGLSEPIVRAVAERGYTEPTPIQRQAIPVVLRGGDLMGGAQTGTGKTAGFTLPILQRLSSAPAPRLNGKSRIRALILTPTRELAAQVEESVRGYGKYLQLSSMVMFGGVNINPQIERLKSRVDILVATPGRLLDHVQQRTIDLTGIEILVLDEADRMLDMGFIRDIRRVLALLPAKRQNLLFSATFSDEIKALADGLLSEPALIEVARRNATADTVAQKIHPVDRDKKRELLSHLIKRHQWFQVLVFTRTKHGANKLAEQLTKDSIPALAIHGNKSQSARMRALSEFKSGELQVLVATDIAARGIDINELPHVVNFELPNVPEDYVHRIGRTGRAGAEGEAISLVCVDEHKLLADIERVIKRPLPREIVQGFEPDPNARAEPIPNGRNRVAGAASAGRGNRDSVGRGGNDARVGRNGSARLKTKNAQTGSNGNSAGSGGLNGGARSAMSARTPVKAIDGTKVQAKPAGDSRAPKNPPTGGRPAKPTTGRARPARQPAGGPRAGGRTR